MHRLPLSLQALFIISILFALPFLANILLTRLRPPIDTGIAPLFSPQVQYWATDIVQWSTTYGIDPNFMATIMQIESCGHPTVASSAGAQGLFQVMPFHFDDGEDMLNPDTNAMRSANFVNVCRPYANDDPGLILACYNGGPGIPNRSYQTWPSETRRYYGWGVGIYADARRNAARSDTLNDWMAAGGVHLCNRASRELGLR